VFVFLFIIAARGRDFAPQLLLRALAAIEQSEIGVREIIAIAIPDISNEIPGKVFCIF